MLASERGKIDYVNALITAGASINLKDKYHGKTALMLASQCGKIDCVYALIAAGANIDLKNKFDTTALIFVITLYHVIELYMVLYTIDI